MEVSEGQEYKLTNPLVQNLNYWPCVQAGNTPTCMQMRPKGGGGKEYVFSWLLDALTALSKFRLAVRANVFRRTPARMSRASWQIGIDAIIFAVDNSESAAANPFTLKL